MIKKLNKVKLIKNEGKEYTVFYYPDGVIYAIDEEGVFIREEENKKIFKMFYEKAND